jgi:hypothetical protein
MAVGRKNWLFAKSADGAKALVAWYSIMRPLHSNTTKIIYLKPMVKLFTTTILL